MHSTGALAAGNAGPTGLERFEPIVAGLSSTFVLNKTADQTAGQPLPVPQTGQPVPQSGQPVPQTGQTVPQTGQAPAAPTISRPQLLQACMQLVNSLVNVPADFNFRIHLRNEFMRTGLADIWEVRVFCINILFL